MQVTIQTDNAAMLAEIERIGIAVRRPDTFTRVSTEGAKHAVQENFRQLNLSRHRPNAPRPGFYASAAESVTTRSYVNIGHISVTGPLGIRQRIHGGTITAKPGKYLAIPVHPRVTGLRAREVYERLGLMTVVNKRTGKGVLVDDNNTVYYALTRSVTQKADPSVLPDDNRLQNAALRAAYDYAQTFSA